MPALEQKQIFIKAGFNSGFVDKALSTPSSGMWKPAAEVMASANVITGLSNGKEFALSGLGADVSQDRLAEMLATGLPLLRALKERFPKEHDGVISTYYGDYVAGQTEADAIVNARARLASILSPLQPLADDAVLADMGAVFADQYAALGAKSPALCYKFASGVGADSNIAENLPAALVDRENEINRRVVETAKKRQDVSATIVGELWGKLGAEMAAKGIGDDQIKLLTSGSVDPSKYREYCQASTTFYREMARLPPSEAAILMRSVLAQKYRRTRKSRGGPSLPFSPTARAAPRRCPGAPSRDRVAAIAADGSAPPCLPATRVRPRAAAVRRSGSRSTDGSRTDCPCRDPTAG